MDHTALAMTLTSAPRPDDAGDANNPATEAGLKSRVRSFLFGGPVSRQRVGRFLIERALGRGGMGTVFLAHDEELDRKVALKLVRADRVSERAQQRLRREARALARLSHPNIVPVFEVGEHEGMIFVAMEYIEGQNLRRWLDSEARPWASVVAVFEQAGRGLAAAHAAGLVHRDFKPENVVVGDDGRVRVVDFGLVAADGEQPAVEHAVGVEDVQVRLPVDAPLTLTGELMGTPAYMAPEQFLGEAPTPASDQFSFFAALFEALEDERAFPGASVADLMKSVLDGDSRSMTRSEIPLPLRESVGKGLSRAPADRFPDMDAALESLGAPPPRGPSRWRALGVAGGMLALAGTIALPVTCGKPGTGASAPDRTANAGSGGRIERDDQASAALSALLAAEDDDARVELGTAYLDTHAAAGGEARRLIAEAIVGGAMWRSSCPAATGGLCLSFESYPPDARLCRDRLGKRFSELSRDPTRSAPALGHLARAEALSVGVEAPGDPDEAAALADALGMTRVYLADAKAERYLLVDAPRGLEWDPGDEAHQELSQEAFAQFMEFKTDGLGELLPMYARVKKGGSPKWVVAGAQRTALVHSSLHDALVNIPIPGAFETDAEQRKAYCDALDRRIAPLRSNARAAHAYCAEGAEQAGVTSYEAEQCALATRNFEAD